MDRQDEPIDGRRRLLLARLGLAATAAYAAPVLLELAPARASGSGGGGGGGQRGGGGRGSPGSFSRPRRQTQRRRPRARPEIVVATHGAAEIDAIAAQGYELLSRDRLGISNLELARFRLPANVTVEQARTQVLGLVPTALFDLNGVYRPGSLECAEGECAAFDMIGWQPGAAGCETPATIGMVDTSVNTGHAALDGVSIETLQVIAEGRQPASAVHGTGIAVLIAGRRDTRTPGLLEGAELIAAEGFHRDPSGQDVADAFDVARAIDRLTQRRVAVINLSFTGPDNAVLARVVENALARNIIIVAAAGNEGPRAQPLFPAAYEGVVAVTAVDGNGRVYRRANAGEHIDFAAPGVQLWTAASISGGRFRSGTSYAAPFVTAALAIARARQPDRPARDLIAELADAAVDLGAEGRDETYGWGLVQSSGGCADRDAVIPAPRIGMGRG